MSLVFRNIFNDSRFATFSTWGNSGIEPGEGPRNQLFRTYGPASCGLAKMGSCDGVLYWT
jgi:hypothetical protein